MTDANTLIRAYVLTNVSNAKTLTSAEQLKSDQFINLIATCNISIKLNSLLPEDEVLEQYRLVFIDCSSFNNESTVPNNILKLAEKSKVALYSCKSGVLCEKSALLSGFYGVFYITDRADIILKGIENLLMDARWFKREIMNVAIAELLNNSNSRLRNTNFGNNDKFVFPSLTKREKTVIQLVASGAQNKEIASTLHISPNTVKTHIYSIFRKTSSRNRIELLSWAKEYRQLN